MTAALDAFVADARTVTIAEAVSRLGISGLVASGTRERVGPCPCCGGKDRFQINAGKNAWLCRGAAAGKDAISLAAHVLALDLSRRENFLAACAAVTGQVVPSEEIENPERRREREAAAERRRADARCKTEQDERTQADFRERELE